ncbi:putative transcriptional regulator [Rhizobium sp. BE258]|nr:putative transcriptional regulator [Rhizobium sp. BE258]
MIMLLQREMDVTSIASGVGLAQSSVSQHLKKLREARTAATRRLAQTIFYTIADDSAARLLRTVLVVTAGRQDKARCTSFASKCAADKEAGDSLPPLRAVRPICKSVDSSLGSSMKPSRAFSTSLDKKVMVPSGASRPLSIKTCSTELIHPPSSCRRSCAKQTTLRSPSRQGHQCRRPVTTRCHACLLVHRAFTYLATVRLAPLFSRTNTLPSRRVPVSRVDISMRTIPIIARRIAMIGTAKLGAFLCSWINGFPPAEGGTTCRPVSNQAVMMKTIVYSVGSTITMRPSAKIKNR